MKALILSGGKGTRLRPLTYSTTKQLIPLANKPILVYLIEKIIKVGIKEIGIIVGDAQEEVKKVIGNGAKWGVNIEYIYQAHSLGLAHAVQTASVFLGKSDFLMVLGDTMLSMDLDVLLESFRSSKANTTILLQRVQDPSQYGVAVVEDGYVTKLVEKPQEFLSDLILTGVYIFDHSIFAAIEKTIPSARGELEITDAIQNQLEQDGKITYELVVGWWKDTGKIEDLLEANRFVLDDMAIEYQSSRDLGSFVTGKVKTGINVIIENSYIQGPVHIDDNVIIANTCIGPYTSIGRGAIIKECELDNCIILEGSELENIKKRISNSFIGKNVSIKSHNIKKRPFFSTFIVGDDNKLNL